MKLPLLALSIAFCSGLAFAETTKEQTPLLPEVKAILEMPAIDEAKMQQNGYVYSLSLSASADDYFAVGKKIILYDDVFLRKIIKEQNYVYDKLPDEIKKEYRFKALEFKRKIEGKDYLYPYPCSFLINHNSVAEVLQDQVQRNTLIADNKVFMERYQHLTQLPEYFGYVNSYHLTMPGYHESMLSILRQSQAIEAINQGEVSKGLTILQQELDFYKRILAGDNDLLSNALVVRRLLTLYHTLESLIDLPIMTKELNNPQLLALFKPLSGQEQQAVYRAFNKETAVTLILFAASSEDSMRRGFLEYYKINKKSKPQYPETLNKNKTLNNLYENTRPLINMAKVTLPEAAEVYAKMPKQMPKALTEDEIYSQYGADNFVGGVLLEGAMITDADYLTRFYDVSNYLALVNVKLQIKQAGIAKEQVPEFLQKLGDKAQNPYSKKPFVWDADKQILASDWLAIKKMDEERNGKRAEVKILF